MPAKFIQDKIVYKYCKVKVSTKDLSLADKTITLDPHDMAS